MSSLFYANEIAFVCRWHEKVIECARPDRLFSVSENSVEKKTHSFECLSISVENRRIELSKDTVDKVLTLEQTSQVHAHSGSLFNRVIYLLVPLIWSTFNCLLSYWMPIRLYLPWWLHAILRRSTPLNLLARFLSPNKFPKMSIDYGICSCFLKKN